MKHHVICLGSLFSTVVRVGFAAVLAAALGFAFQAATQSANAQTRCSTRAQVIKQLGGAYSESPVAIGLASSGGAVFELFATDDGSTWTIVMTRPDGNSCLIAAGEARQNLPVKSRGPRV